MVISKLCSFCNENGSNFALIEFLESVVYYPDQRNIYNLISIKFNLLSKLPGNSQGIPLKSVLPVFQTCPTVSILCHSTKKQ